VVAFLEVANPGKDTFSAVRVPTYWLMVAFGSIHGDIKLYLSASLQGVKLLSLHTGPVPTQ